MIVASLAATAEMVAKYTKIYSAFFSRSHPAAKEKVACPAQFTWTKGIMKWTWKLIQNKFHCHCLENHITMDNPLVPTKQPNQKEQTTWEEIQDDHGPLLFTDSRNYDRAWSQRLCAGRPISNLSRGWLVFRLSADRGFMESRISVMHRVQGY